MGPLGQAPELGTPYTPFSVSRLLSAAEEFQGQGVPLRSEVRPRTPGSTQGRLSVSQPHRAALLPGLRQPDPSRKDPSRNLTWL